MIGRFLKSRGARKFRRNRIAMAALGVIALYASVGLWIAVTEGLEWVGHKIGALSIQERPLLGFLLPSRTAERVGPPLMAGLGIRQGADRRSDQYAFLLNQAGQVVRDLERYDDGGRAPEIRERARMAERRLADRPLGQLKADLADAEAALIRMDDLRRRASALNTALFQSGKLRAYERRLRDAAETLADIDADEKPERHAEAAAGLRRAREDLSLTLEEVVFAVEDFLELDGAEAGPLAQLDTEPLTAAAAELNDPGFAHPHGPDRPLYDAALVDRIREEARVILGTLSARVDAQLDEVEPILAGLYPMPAGLEGVLYKARILLGTDRQGRSIFIRSVYSAKIAIQVGVVTALLAVTFGSLLGASAAFFGRWVDHGAVYLYSVFTAIPDLVLLVVLAFMFQAGDWKLPWDPDKPIANTLIPIYAAFALTFWIGPCRVIRGEVLKVKELEYVQAARAIGFGRMYIMLKHVLPNTTHLIFISFSLLFIAAIKGEVVLTFLGLGLKDGASWGLMIQQSRPEVVSGFFWQIGAATFFMLVLVLAFNIVSDALQDAFDPKHV